MMAESSKETTAEDQPKGRTVLIAMDGSKHAINAFEWYVGSIYRPTDNVIMAHCAETEVKLPTQAYLVSPATIHALVSEHQQKVKHVFQVIDELAKKHNVKHTLERINSHSKPGEAIIHAADQQNVDLIIVGSRGMGTLRRTIMGSVSDYIVHHSHVPVIVCKHEDEHHKLN